MAHTHVQCTYVIAVGQVAWAWACSSARECALLDEQAYL